MAVFLGAPAAQVVGKIRELMPRDKVALLINSCAKKPKPRRVAAVAPSAPRRKLRRIGSKSRISSSDNLAALAEPGPPGSDSLDGVKRKRGGLGSLEAQAAVADADDDLARRVAQVELDAKAAEVAAPALATMDGSLHALPSKPAPGLDDMDGSLYNLRAFG